MDKFGGGGDGLGWDLSDDAKVSLAAREIGDVEGREVGHLQWCGP